jgi:hypothetical protein
VTARAILYAALAAPFVVSGVAIVVIAVREAGRILSATGGIVADPPRATAHLYDAPLTAEEEEYLDRLAIEALGPMDPFEVNQWARRLKATGSDLWIVEGTER